MYRANGPVEMRPVGEVEFVAGIAAMSAGGGHGPIKVAQGIVGYADLTLGDRVEPVLEVTWVGSSKMEMRTRLFPRDAGQPCRLTRRDGARPPVVEGKHEEIDEKALVDHRETGACDDEHEPPHRQRRFKRQAAALDQSDPHPTCADHQFRDQRSSHGSKSAIGFWRRWQEALRH